MTEIRVGIVILLSCLILQCITALPDPLKNQTSSDKNIRDDILEKIFRGYRKHERPNPSTVTNVDVNIKIIAIFSINVRTMDYNMDVYLRQYWTDPRLSWKDDERLKVLPSIASPKIREKLWLPDLFFRNGKEGFLHEMTLPNFLIRVYNDGSILYSQKITMRFSCQMNLQTFPMDTQICDMNIGSYAYTAKELKFAWRPNKSIEIDPALQVSEFNKPEAFNTIDCTNDYSTATGKFSCLIARFRLKRQLGSYLATTYIPNILIIIASWLSFWVNVDAAPARVPLGLLSLLGILTQATGVTANLPRVSYIKAIDIWTIFSIIFVIGVLVEYAIALTMQRKKRSDSWHQDVNEIVRQELIRWCAACQQQQITNSNQNYLSSDGNFDSIEGIITKQVVDQHKKSKQANPPSLVESEVDIYSRFLFPSCYILYNCFYWLYYLVLVEYFKSDNQTGNF